MLSAWQCKMSILNFGISITAYNRSWWEIKSISLLMDIHQFWNNLDFCWNNKLPVSNNQMMINSILLRENHSNISEREVEIVHLLSMGYNSKEIGEMLYISEHTVNTHRRNMVRKLDLKNSYQLIVWAFKERILSF